MYILIVEDEKLAAKKLTSLIEGLIDDLVVVGVAKSIDEAVAIIESNEIDLGFFDIQIEDGLSFDIFEKTKISFPVIFTTAYNEYAIKANLKDYSVVQLAGLLFIYFLIRKNDLSSRTI